MRYVAEAKAQEAKLALERLQQAPQQASSFFDSDAGFSDDDILWNKVNGNISEESSTTVCDSKSLFKSELPESGFLQRNPSMHSFGNGQGIDHSSSPVLKFRQFATNPPIQQVGAGHSSPMHKIAHIKTNPIENAAAMAPTLLSLTQIVPNRVPFVIRPSISGQSQIVLKNPVPGHRIIQVQNKPSAIAIMNPARIAPTLLPLLETAPSQNKNFTYLPARRILRLENTPSRIANVERELIPNAETV